MGLEGMRQLNSQMGIARIEGRYKRELIERDKHRDEYREIIERDIGEV
jgi:hypothetical protein